MRFASRNQAPPFSSRNGDAKERESLRESYLPLQMKEMIYLPQGLLIEMRESLYRIHHLRERVAVLKRKRLSQQGWAAGDVVV